MVQVSNQTELEAAIAALDPDIQVIANFNITALQPIKYTTTISSGAGGPYTLTKDDSYSSFLFRVESGGSLTLTNIIVDGAKETHGADSESLIWVPSGTLIVDDGAILQNNLGNNGGAITRLESGPNHIMIRGNAIIRNNEARGSGGAIYTFISNGGSLQLSGQARIENNKSSREGGGIHFLSYRQDVDLIISDNVVITGNTSATNGGGIYMWQGGCNITGNVQISGNQAESGGGLGFDGSDITIEDTVKIQDNIATNQGGGILLLGLGNTTAIHGQMIGNTAEAYGGGVNFPAPANGGTVDFSRALFSGNKAFGGSIGFGGGLNIRDESGSTEPLALLLNNTTFEYNESAGDGSAICLHYTGPLPLDLQATNCQFVGNTAHDARGAVFLDVAGRCTARFQNCDFSFNEATLGGALYVANSSSTPLNFQMTGGKFRENTARSSGGAMVFDFGNMDVTLNHILLEDNRAETGAGLYVHNGGGSITIENDSVFSQNQAVYGGGIYHDGNATLDISGTSFFQNTARGIGAGIYNDGPLQLGPGVLEQDGLYFNNLAAAPVIGQHLTSDAVVQLAASGYVTPNPEGTPIVVAQSGLTLTAADAAAFRPPATAGFNGWGPWVSENGREIVLAPVVYTLQYENTMGAENPNPTQYTVLTPGIILEPLAATEAQRFVGWYDAAEGGDRVLEIPLSSTGNRTLYARWQARRRVTYFPNDAAGPAAENIPQPQQVWNGENLTLSDQSPTRAGFAFLNWNTNPEGTGRVYQPDEDIPSVTADLNLYAQWQALPPTEHVLSYQPNDAGGPPAHNLPKHVLVLDGDTAVVSLQIPTRDSYAFTGWNTGPDGTGTHYQPGGSIPNVRGDVNLYAQWLYVAPVVHSVAFYGNTDGVLPARWVPGMVQVENGQSVTLSSIVPMREGFAFAGWNTQPFGGGTVYQPGGTIPNVAADLHLYAQWV